VFNVAKVESVQLKYWQLISQDRKIISCFFLPMSISIRNKAIQTLVMNIIRRVTTVLKLALHLA